MTRGSMTETHEQEMDGEDRDDEEDGDDER